MRLYFCGMKINNSLRGNIMNRDLTKGSVVKAMLLFAIPMILGDLLQQCYNIADTLIVGRFLGDKALAAVGSSFTLMTFVTSIILGLCMGSSALFSMRFGQRDEKGLKEDISASFFFIVIVTLLLIFVTYISLEQLRIFLNVPYEVWGNMKEYLFIIFMGIPAIFLYNYFASYLRAIGNSVIPLMFLAVSSVVNILLDLWFVVGFRMGVAGSAEATVIAQYLSGFGIMLYAFRCYKQVHIIFDISNLKKKRIREIISFSMLTCIQQSVMNLGILMVQGLVNSFGTVIMAAFAAAVKIDAFAYMPVQDFGNAFSTFIAQNYGAKEKERIQQGLKDAVCISAIFCIVISVLVYLFAKQLMMLFVDASSLDIIMAGVQYLHIEGAFYIGIGWLFLLYGLYRALGRPGMSVILTVLSLGTRVVLAYIMSSIPQIGVIGIWWSVPIGWALADFVGFLYYKIKKHDLFVSIK